MNSLLFAMAETLAIRPSDLVFDSQNPRLVQPNVGQREIFRSLANLQQRKILFLAKDILRFGVNPSDLLIVMREAKARNRFVALEGNRRLAALRALENPEPLVGAVDDVVIKELRQLSRSYQEDPTEYVNCSVVKDRDEAKHWIELRHTGQNRGAGVVPWGSEESARFSARSGETEPHIQALDFLESHGLGPQTRASVPVTSFRRLLGTPEVRAKLGIDVRNKQLEILGNTRTVGRALLHIAKDLAEGDTKVADIYTKKQRIAYIKKLPKSLLSPRKTAPKKVKAVPTRRKRKAARSSLIPSDCVLAVTEDRASDIEDELRRLKFSGHTNAIAVLFRVFVELSVDSHIATHKIRLSKPQRLAQKMDAVLRDLLQAKKMSKEQARPVRSAMPTVTEMHDWVHNAHAFPEPATLRANWSNLQPFLTAIWAP